MGQKIQNALQDIYESIKGSGQDFTSGSLKRAIFLLAVPMVLEMAMESVFAVVDIFFVAKLGSDAVATVGITESVMTILYAIALGLGMGTTALISRRVGEHRSKDASVTAAQSVLIGVLLSVPIAIAGIWYSPRLLELMGSSHSMIESGYRYPQVIIGFNIVIMLLFIINSIFRGAGDAALSMRILWLSNLINIVLDPCLIFGWGPFPELGLAGAAIATTIGRGSGVLLQIYYLFNGKHRIRIMLRDFIPKMRLIWKLIRISLGGIGQFLISTSSWIALYRIISTFGSIAVAGYTISIRILIFSLLPSWGLSNAASTMVGQNLGAKKPDRAERSVIITAKINFVFLTCVAVLFLIYAADFIEIFTTEPGVVDAGKNALKFLSMVLPFYAVGMIMIQALNGSGDTKTPTIINFFCFWLIEIPVAYILSYNMNFGVYGVYAAIVLADLMIAAIGIIIFRKGKWKDKIV
jgi:putative MATE family efflux protein